MFTYQELSGKVDSGTFTYWVLVEKEPLSNSEAELDGLKSLMGYHYGSEEQAYEPESLLDDERFEKLQPIAPVTLAEAWAPFELSREILGEPIVSKRGEGSNSAAMAIWNPQFLGGCEPDERSEHPRHFVFLLRLACSLAEELNGRVLIVGSPGWSYSHWKNDSYMMNPETALLMNKAGYLYTDRIAQ